MKKLLATVFLALGISGIFAGAAPVASADHGLLHFDLEGGVNDEIPEEGPLVCADPHIRVFGNVLLNDPICI